MVNYRYLNSSYKVDVISCGFTEDVKISISLKKKSDILNKKSASA